MYVKKIFLPTSIVCLLTIFFAFSSFKANSKKATNISAAPAVEKTSVEEDNTLSVKAASNLIYDSLHLADLGMSKEVLQYAYKGQQQLAERGVLNNEDIIAI